MTVKDILKVIGFIVAMVVGFILFVQVAFLIVGPDYEKGEYTMVYRVYYPGNPKTYTIKNEWPIDVESSRGTNRVVKVKTNLWKKAFREETVFSTSAPIEIVSYAFNKIEEQ